MVILNVQTVNLTVMVMELNVFMVHGHVTVMVTVQTVLMKLIVVDSKAVQMVNSIVAMKHVFMVHGHVTDILIVQLAQTKLTVAADRKSHV